GARPPHDDAAETQAAHQHTEPADKLPAGRTFDQHASVHVMHQAHEVETALSRSLAPSLPHALRLIGLGFEGHGIDAHAGLRAGTRPSLFTVAPRRGKTYGRGR